MKRGNTYAPRSSVGSRCCGVVENVARARRRARTQPSPWIVRKFMVGVTTAMMMYSLYVFIGRLCVDMIKRKAHAGGSRGAGIALLVVVSILWLWMIWAYAKVVFTSPGYAKDHVSKSDRPMFPEPPNPFTHYDHIIENSRYRPREPNGAVDQESIAGPSYETIPARAPAKSAPKPVADNGTASEEKTEEDSKNSLPPRKPELVYTRHKEAGDYLHRRPPATPVLRPEHRYCEIDRIVKPYRTHHCRSCGTCILKYDHHCPWIGQCVGARNQKFFMNFIQAASVYAIYICVTLLVFVVLRATSADRYIDPQKIVIVALAGLFAVFTTVMQCTHLRLIWHGQTTVESIGAHRMRRREKQAMNDVIGYWAILAKRRKKRRYDEEWGRITHEGNIWWLGSGKEGWVDVMGRDVCGWFLPIGRSLNDGLTYPVNPRFDAQGIWRKRAEWPEELR